MESASASVAEDNKRVQEIINNVQLAVEMLEKSSFFGKFMKEMQDPEIVPQIKRVVGADPQYSQIQLVLYGVGEMERIPEGPSVEVCHTQLAFAILIRKKFQWVNDIVVYDPVVSPLQQKAINAFNCNFLSVNEYGKRTVDRPTLFFMPFCPTVLVNNVLIANWTTTNLNKIIILGYSFESLKKEIHKEDRFRYLCALKHLQAILHSDNILHEMRLTEPEPEPCEPSPFCSFLYNDNIEDSEPGQYSDEVIKEAFHDFSWHFFTLDGSIEDLNLGLFPEVPVA